ncbi:hypothetical protein CAPTEDRAFT_219724 [Capitella teleta]|uniref:CUB domain-containing protein n=1 Tax=Capitella teleta TaxID=283909 RepID=R7V3K9_CAPTE|nr:hypothetical protein CAPTEDRAFT_219724 [Capitella teleta]|eukprot:ELU10390.1 hypothetical protein CAPTEDRAFT_219724 [Capitella teleta]
MLMTDARYGRFRVDRCVIQNYGHLGCSANVLDLLDKECSGRPQCYYNIPSLRNLVQPCPKDLTSHLEATYECISVVSRTQNKCNSTILLNASVPHVNVAHHVAMQGGPGSASCPIGVRASTGQRLNVSVYSFQQGLNVDLQTGGKTMCPFYAVVVDGTRVNSTQLCDQRHRHEHVMTSEGSHVMFYFYAAKHSTQRSPGFVVRIEASGCPDVMPPKGAWVERSADRAVVRCNHSQETWYLTCRDNVWVGTITNCSSYSVPANGGQVDTRSGGLPFGLMVAITIGIVLGIIFGIAMLVAVFVYRRKRRQKTPPKVNALLAEERDGSQQDSDDIYVRRMWHECSGSSAGVALNSGTAGIYGRTACHTHPVSHHVCAGDYTQMLELKCANTPPSTQRECVYGSRQVKFIDPRAGLITYPTYKSTEGLYDTHPSRQPPPPPPPACDHYSIRASEADPLTPDQQPDVVQTNGKEGEPSDNIRNLQQWLEEQSVKRPPSQDPSRGTQSHSS